MRKVPACADHDWRYILIFFYIVVTGAPQNAAQVRRAAAQGAVRIRKINADLSARKLARGLKCSLRLPWPRLAGALSGTRCTHTPVFETRDVAGAPQNAFPARSLACVSASSLSAGRSGDGAGPAICPDPW